MFKDEEIIEKRNRERRKKYTGIDTGIYIGEDLLEFSEFRLFDKVGVVLPITYQDMDLEEARKKYPSEQRPQIIKTNQDGSINFAFNLLKQKTEASQLEAIAYDFMRVLKRLYPTNICLKIETGEGLHLPYASVEFTSTAINETLYNMVIIHSIGEELMLLLFNCPFQKRNEWTRCLSQIRENIADYSGEETYEAN